MKDREPFTLLTDGSQTSADAMQILKENDVPFFPFRSPETRTPWLITPVGSFQGVEKIRLYAGIHAAVTKYLDSLPDSPSKPPTLLSVV